MYTNILINLAFFSKKKLRKWQLATIGYDCDLWELEEEIDNPIKPAELVSDEDSLIIPCELVSEIRENVTIKDLRTRIIDKKRNSIFSNYYKGFVRIKRYETHVVKFMESLAMEYNEIVYKVFFNFTTRNNEEYSDVFTKEFDNLKKAMQYYESLSIFLMQTSLEDILKQVIKKNLKMSIEEKCKSKSLIQKIKNLKHKYKYCIKKETLYVPKSIK